MARFRRLARDYERLTETLAGLHFVAFAILIAERFVTAMSESASQIQGLPSIPTVSTALPNYS